MTKLDRKRVRPQTGANGWIDPKRFLRPAQILACAFLFLQVSAHLGAAPLDGALNASVCDTAQPATTGRAAYLNCAEVGLLAEPIQRKRPIRQVDQGQDDDEEVAIPDRILRGAITYALGKAGSDPITRSDIAGLTALYHYYGGISDLTGLESAVNLEELELEGAAVANCPTGEYVYDWVPDLAPLSGLSKLTYLRINSYCINDIGPLQGLTGLEVLHLAYNSITDIGPLSGLAALSELYLEENSITDIEPLSGLTGLYELYLIDNLITDIGPLRGLRGLGYLNLSRNSISNIGPLSGLTNLSSLGLSRNTISNIDALASLTNLSGLSLNDNSISNIDALAGLTNLYSLILDDNSISDIGPLSAMTLLGRLDLSDNSISDVGALAGLTELESLWLSNNTISDIGALSALSEASAMPFGNVSVIDLSDNSISEVGPLSGARISRLNLSRNAISDLSSLTGLLVSELDLSENSISNLGSLSDVSVGHEGRLDLSDNSISNIEALSGMTDLSNLDLSNNSISNIDSLSEMVKNFRSWCTQTFKFLDLSALPNSLDLSNNSISDIEPLSGMIGACLLDLSGNVIADIGGLSGLERVGELNASGNAITDVGALSGVSSAQSLNLSDNSIVDLDPLSNIGVGDLDLSGNSITSLDALSEMRIRYLNLTDNAISDISALSGLEPLERLDLAGNSINDIGPLSGMTNIRSLDLSRNSINDIGPLSGMTGLNWLVLYGNEITDVSPLVENPGIRSSRDFVWLGCCHPDTHFEYRVQTDTGLSNPLSDTSIANDLPALTGRGVRVYFSSDDFIEVVIPDEQLRTAARVAGAFGFGTRIVGADMARVTRMDASNWGIVDLTGLEYATALEWLDLSDNEISDIGPLAGLTRLAWLDLSGNSGSSPGAAARPGNARTLSMKTASVLMDLEPLSELVDLEWLDLSDNGLSDITPLASLVNLTYLNLEGNAITDLAPIAGLPNLKELRLAGNPLSDESIGVHLAALEAAGVAVYVANQPKVRHVVSLFPASGDASGRQGFLRVINHSYTAGEASVATIDDTESVYDPITLTIGAKWTVHFNSDDLEMGNSSKGLSGGTGPGQGDWRLELTSDLDIDVLSYIRTTDGFLTSMHDVAPVSENTHRVVIFNPGSNMDQVSSLRLINPGDEEAQVTIRGIDDAGESPGGDVELSVAAGAARTVTAAELESGAEDLQGALGDGTGKWSLTVESEQPLIVMSLLESPTGHLTNLSTLAAAADGGPHLVHLFPAAGDASGRQGFVRVINHSDTAGEVSVAAVNDTEWVYDPVTLTIGAKRTVHFNSDDLEMGNSSKGLSGGTGSGQGDWRLELTSDLDIDVLSYIRTTDGFLTSMHDVAPVSENTYRVVIFNPGSNMDQVSSLRLINPGDEEAQVRIRGIDDAGESPGGDVELSVAAGAARTVTAAALESGADGLQGALGDGAGKWSLTVKSVQPLIVMSLLESPTGHLTNVSTEGVGQSTAGQQNAQ